MQTTSLTISPCPVESAGYEPGSAYCPECRRVHVGASLEMALDATERGAAWRQRQRVIVSEGRYGPGTELESLLEKDLLLAKNPLCDCPKKVVAMNQWGVDGCRVNRAEIVSWLDAGCKKTPVTRKLIATAFGFFKMPHVALRALKGTLVDGEKIDILGRLVDEAIQRADAKQRAVPKFPAKRERAPAPAAPKSAPKGCTSC